MTTKERPAFVTDEMLDYLDELRETARINMFAAAPYLVRDFSLDRHDAKDALLYWMDSFDKRHPL